MFVGVSPCLHVFFSVKYGFFRVNHVFSRRNYVAFRVEVWICDGELWAF